MAQLRIRLLGGFGATCNEEPLDEWGSSKAEELLCYLLLSRDRPHARELLASALWEHATTTQSKAYLRKTLWQVQSVFKSRPDLAALKVLLVSQDWIQCNPELDLWLDVEVFEEAYTSSEAVEGANLSPQQIEKLRSALDLYEGDLLEHLYQDWCLYERERLRHLYFAMSDKLTSYYEMLTNYEVATSYAERALYHDRAREYTHRQLMRLRYFSEDRTGAIRQYESCVRALHEELDIGPADATIRLYEQIRTDRLSVEADGSPSRPRTAAITAFEMISQLRAALNHLAEAQERVRREINVLEETLMHVDR